MAEPHAQPLNSKQLVDEFKKSGEFDRLRRQLLTHFVNSDEVRPLMSRIEDIAREKLSGDEQLEHKAREVVHAEVMQDMERYPIVERAVADLGLLKDEALLTSIEQYARNILRGESNENTKLWEAKPSRRRSHEEEEEDNDGSSYYTNDDEPSEVDLLIITDAKRNTAASSQSPEPELGQRTAVAAPVENRPNSPQLDPNLGSTLATTPPGNPAAPNLNTGPQTPPWPDPHHARPPPTRNSVHSGRESEPTSSVRPPSSDTRAGELLVNGVSAAQAYETSRDANPSPETPREQNRRDDQTASGPARESQAGETYSGQEMHDIKIDDPLVNPDGSTTLPPPLRPSSPSHTPPLSPLSTP